MSKWTMTQAKVDYRPQQNNTAYWRNVANQGRGAHMTQCLHEACDFIHKLESENAEMAELLAECAERIDGKWPLDLANRVASLLERINK